MGWQQRLRDLILASGGAIAAAACTGKEAGTPVDDGGPALNEGGPSLFCCNANSDPCCGYLHCGGSMTPACAGELACQADGGTWQSVGYQLPDGGWAFGSCTVPGDGGVSDGGDEKDPNAPGPVDAAPLDAAPSDAGPFDAAPLDAGPFDAPFPSMCCNANSDPCCPYVACGAPMTPLCAEKLACEADGGAWDSVGRPLPDGGWAFGACTLPVGVTGTGSDGGDGTDGGDSGGGAHD
ncbi:MAG: hypothetical protein JOZ69_14915 [Myxococcales bacterium]|nr:hypothetical protein [Myxococcales bacterium]